MGPVFCAIVAIIGHLLTALTSGFPMTLPVHCVIALGMMPLLGIVGGLNALIAAAVYKALPQSVKNQFQLVTKSIV